jgi:hypothetical protein
MVVFRKMLLAKGKNEAVSSEQTICRLETREQSKNVQPVELLAFLLELE